MNIKDAIKIVQGLSPKLRSMRYQVWKERHVMAPVDIAAVEAAYPGVVEKPLPSLGAMAVNASKAAVRSLLQAANGGGFLVPEDEAWRRQTICRSNRCTFFRASDERCAHQKCGCYLKIKPWLKAEKCPLSLW